MEAPQILKWLEDRFPNKLPLGKVDEFELGLLLGQQKVLETLRMKLNVLQEKEIKDK